jgi:hypothetical protein
MLEWLDNNSSSSHRDQQGDHPLLLQTLADWILASISTGLDHPKLGTVMCAL